MEDVDTPLHEVVEEFIARDALLLLRGCIFGRLFGQT